MVHAAPPWVPLVTAVLFSTFTFADTVGSAPKFDMLEPHLEVRAIYLPTSYGAEKGSIENVPIYALVRVTPSGQESKTL